MTPYGKPSFITCILVLNNNTALNGGITFTCIYLLKPNPLYYVLWIKYGIAHTACQFNIQATLSFIKLHRGSPKINAS